MSESKLTSPTPASVLVSSLERLGGDSPVTGVGGTHKRLSFAPAPSTPTALSMLRPHQEAHLSGLRRKGHLQCLGTVLVVTVGGNATGVGVEARDAVMLLCTPQYTGWSPPTCRGAKARKPWDKVCNTNFSVT